MRLGSKDWLSTLWDLNGDTSDSECKALTHHAIAGKELGTVFTLIKTFTSFQAAFISLLTLTCFCMPTL